MSRRGYVARCPSCRTTYTQEEFFAIPATGDGWRYCMSGKESARASGSQWLRIRCDGHAILDLRKKKGPPRECRKVLYDLPQGTEFRIRSGSAVITFRTTRATAGRCIQAPGHEGRCFMGNDVKFRVVGRVEAPR